MARRPCAIRVISLYFYLLIVFSCIATKESSYMKLPSLGSAFITFNGLGRESGVNSIVYNMAGDLFAVVCTCEHCLDFFCFKLT